jgi:hypothetical protein
MLMTPKEAKFWSKIKIGGGCWLWTGCTNDMGYARFYYQGKYYTAGKVAWELAEGPIPEGAAVRHTCKENLCVRPSHLTLDKRLVGKDVLIIRHRLHAGDPVKLLAEEYKISVSTVDDIQKRRTWKHVQ